MSVHHLEAAEDCGRLHHHFTNPTIIGCSQAGAGTGQADAGRLLLAPPGHPFSVERLDPGHRSCWAIPDTFETMRLQTVPGGTESPGCGIQPTK